MFTWQWIVRHDKATADKHNAIDLLMKQVEHASGHQLPIDMLQLTERIIVAISYVIRSGWLNKLLVNAMWNWNYDVSMIELPT